MIQREEIWKWHNIDGSLCGDYCTMYWCICRAVVQENEVKRGEQVKVPSRSEAQIMLPNNLIQCFHYYHEYSFLLLRKRIQIMSSTELIRQLQSVFHGSGYLTAIVVSLDCNTHVPSAEHLPDRTVGMWNRAPPTIHAVAMEYYFVCCTLRRNHVMGKWIIGT